MKYATIARLSTIIIHRSVDLLPENKQQCLHSTEIFTTFAQTKAHGQCEAISGIGSVVQWIEYWIPVPTIGVRLPTESLI